MHFEFFSLNRKLQGQKREKSRNEKVEDLGK
jgi:hypothetical protein